MRAADKQVSSAASATLREMVPAAVYDYIQQQQLYPPT
jgi:nicotinic acid mononucleotide adenylyltransferase